MSIQSIISRYNHMNGNTVSGATLREFHQQIQTHLDRSATGPFTKVINGIRSRLATVLKNVKSTDLVEVRVKLIDVDAVPSLAKATDKKKKEVSIPEKHRKKIAAQNKKTIRDVLNGSDESLIYGLPLNPPEAKEENTGLGFTKEGQQKIYDMVTNMILETMKSGKDLFWREPWTGGGKKSKKVKVNVMGPLPVNFVSKTPYSGINYWLLKYVATLKENYQVLNYLTINQVNEMGGKVKKGATAWPVIYYTLIYKYEGKNISEDQYESLSESEQKKAQKIPVVQYYKVFNAQDIEGVPGVMEQVQARKTVLLYEVEPIKAAEAIVDGMPKRPHLQQSKQRRAYYNPGGDFVHMPYIGVFDQEQEYYSTFFHELVHSTGHKSRLERELSQDKKKYAFEELIAELGASYLCAESGILYYTLKNSAAYINGWSGRLREEMQADKKFFLKAAAKAQQASNFILDVDKNPKKETKKAFKPKSRGKKVYKQVAGINKVVKVDHKPKRETKRLLGHSKKVVKASSLAGITFTTIPLNAEFKRDFHRINSDSVLMVWGLPGSGKTYKLLKLAKYLAEQNRKVLFVAEEEYGRSTFAEKLREINIGDQVDFTPHIDESILNDYDTIFLDSVNSLGLTAKDVKKMINAHPGKLWVLIVQTTKEGDFRGGQDWEHLVDIAGEVVNRKMILRKNRLDKNNKEKADALRIEEKVNEKIEARRINELVKNKIEPPVETEKQNAA